MIYLYLLYPDGTEWIFARPSNNCTTDGMDPRFTRSWSSMRTHPKDLHCGNSEYVGETVVREVVDCYYRTCTINIVYDHICI
jgi:hypothetical protein